MTNKIYKLGELIEICDERNTDLKFGIDDVRGISIQKKFIDYVGWASLPTTTAEYICRVGILAHHKRQNMFSGRAH